MTLVRLNAGITNAKGSISGCYYHRDGSGLHLSSNPQRVSTQSNSQKLQRGIFSRCINAFTEHDWTPDELQAWFDFADRHYTSSNATTRKNRHIQNLFVGYNCVRMRNNLPISYSPPND